MTYTPGIGAALGSSWATRETLTPSTSGIVAEILTPWFFAVEAPVAAAFAPGHGALAGVMAGWTGTIEYDDGVINPVLSPMARESAASILARLVHVVYAETGTRLAVSVDASGVITIAHPTVPISLYFDGNCDNRTGFTGSYLSAPSHTAAASYEQGWVADRGMRQDAPLWSTSGERGAVGDGSCATAPTRAPARARYVAWDSVTYLPDLSREYDYWHDGRLFGRFVVESARLVPLGITRATNNITVEIDIGEVA